MTSAYLFLFTLRLFFELSSHSAVAAMPATLMDDGASDEYGLIRNDKPIVEPPPSRRSLALDSGMRGNDGRPKIIIVSESRLSGHSLREPPPPLNLDHSLSHPAPEYSLKIDQRDTDMDMLRCMIGRVYRPCWEA